MLKYRKSRVITRSTLVVAAALCSLQGAARSAVLEQQWQAGQQLSYDFNVDGTMNITAPEGLPGLLAWIGGMPLTFMIKGDGQNTLNTQNVDEFGTALVALKLERMQLKINETTLGQNGVLGIRDGKANLTVNGQQAMPARDVSRVLEPRYGLRITKQFHVVGAAPLASAPEEDAPADDKNPEAQSMRLPINMATMIQAMMARTLPALWPTRDVAVGDTWQANIEWPQPPSAVRSELQKPAGQFSLKADGEDEVLGRKTLRVALDGTIQVDPAQAQIIGDEIAKRRAENDTESKPPAPGVPAGVQLPRFLSLTQKVKGNLWFDQAAGQIIRTDLQLSTNARSGKDVKKAEGSMDFVGNLKMELRKVSYESEAAK